MTKIPAFVTDNLTVQWGHLHQLDVAFGENSANHNISVIVSPEFKKKLESLKKETKATKINAYRAEKDRESGEPTGRMIFKAKTSFFKDGGGGFPCVDASNQVTDAQPFGGDVVRLRLAPRVQSDGSLSLYLNGCQIIEKNDSGASGFDKVEGGFDGTNAPAPTNAKATVPADDDGIPF